MSPVNWVDDADPKHTSFPVHNSAVITSLVLWNNNIITASDDQTINIYSTDGNLIRSLQGHKGGVWALALHGDTLISSATDKSIKIWDLQTGRCTHSFKGHTGTVRCMVLAEDRASEILPQQNLIVTGSRDRTVGIWALPRPGEPEYKDSDEDDEDAAATAAANNNANPYHLFRLNGHEDSIRGLSACGRRAASASYDCTVRIWDILAGQCLFVLRGHKSKG
jgi:F-box and WD-40 domain protein CDC4